MSAFLMLSGVALAQQLPHALSPTTYIFETNARSANDPLYTERWELRADETMTIHSGEEVVEKSYKLTHVAVCPPSSHTPDGSPFVSDCFATLRRVEPSAE